MVRSAGYIPVEEGGVIRGIGGIRGERERDVY